MLQCNYIFRCLVIRRFIHFITGGFYDPCLHCGAYYLSTAISHCMGPFWRCHVLLMSWQTCYCFINSRGWLHNWMLPNHITRIVWFRIIFYNSINIFYDILIDLSFPSFFIFLEGIIFLQSPYWLFLYFVSLHSV